MEAERAQNLQDTFLNHVRKNKTPLTIFLVNGVKLQGVVTWFDNFCVLLRRDGHTQLVYKHAISTVTPGAPIQLFDASKAEGGAAAPAGVREMSAVAGGDYPPGNCAARTRGGERPNNERLRGDRRRGEPRRRYLALGTTEGP